MPRKVPKRKPKALRTRGRPDTRPDLGALLSSPEIAALLGPDEADLPPDDPTDLAIDPGLMALAIAFVAEDMAGTGEGVILYSAARAYAAYYDKDADNPVADAEVPKIAELARRMSATATIVQDLDLSAMPDPDRLLVVAAAACATPLMASGPPPAFEPAAFVAAVERAKAALR